MKTVWRKLEVQYSFIQFPNSEETDFEKLQDHLCSQAPNLVLGFTEQTKLNVCQAEGPLPCTGRIKSEQ